jgi:hypothetical protein
VGVNPRELQRWAWIGGILYVTALLAESVVSVGVKSSQDDSAAKIAHALHQHETRLIVVACISIVYAVGFVLYLTRLHDVLRGDTRLPAFLGSWVLAGGILFVALHGVSDIGITGMLGGKVAAYADQHDHGLAYGLYLLTFALDSVGDVFASLFMLAAGLLAHSRGLLPHWLAGIAVLASPFLFLQAFGLGGVIATFGLTLDLIGFLLLLIFVLGSSTVLLLRERALPSVA